MPSVRTLILWLVIGSMLPAMIGATYLFVVRIQEGSEQLEKSTLQSTRDLSLALDQKFSQVEVAALMLAQAPLLKTNNLAPFYHHAANAMASTHIDGNVVLSDASRQVVLNTLVDFGTALPMYGNQAQLRQVFATGQTVVSDVFTGRLTGKPSLSVAVPVMNEGKVIYALSISLTTDSLGTLIRKKNFDMNWIVTLFDSTGTIAARSHKSTEFVGRKTTPETLAQFVKTKELSFISETKEGIAVLAAFSTAPHSGWGAAIGIPRQQLEATLIRQASLMGLGLLLLFGLGVALALFQGRRIASSVTGLTLPARDLIAGKLLSAPKVHFSEAKEVVLAMAKTAQQLALKTSEANQTLEDLEVKVKTRTQEFFDLYEQAPIGYHTLNAEGVVTQVNQAQLDLLGFTREEYVGQRVTRFFTPQSQTKFARGFLQTQRDGKLRGLEFAFIGKSGEHIPVLVSANFIRDMQGQFIAARSTIVDNRVNLAQKQQLKDLNNFLGDVLESLPIAVMVLNKTRQVVLKNKLVPRMLDYPPELLERADLNFSDIVRFNCDWGDHPDQAYEAVLSERLAMMETQEIVHLERQQHNGIYLSIGSQRIADDWILLTCTDISASKIAEQALQSAKQLADIANLAKSSFLANISHELRTPLNAVVGLTGLLLFSPMRPRQQDYAEKIQLSAQILLTLINDLLDFSKMEANELRLEAIPFSLADLLSDITPVMGLGAGSLPIEVVLDIAPDVPDALVGDRLRLQQILLNLTSNAVKFTRIGEIVVKVRCLSGPACQEGAQATLLFSVRDTGIGMAANSLGFVFDAFTQAHASTSRLYGGTGLGLAICAQLVTLMGGYIDVDSTLGQGSEFHIELPLSLGRPVEAAKPSGLPVGLRILVVDDHPLSRVLLMQYATAQGCLVHAFDSGAAGLQALSTQGSQEGAYDLLLLDIQMPLMDGYATTRFIRKKMGLLDLPIFAVTAFALPEDQEKSQQAGMQGHLVKPLNVDALKNLVARLGNASARKRPDVATPDPAGDFRLEGLDFVAAMKTFGGNKVKFGSILRKFVLQQGEDVANARRLFIGNDPEGARRLVHDLRGVAGFLHAGDLLRQSAAVETALQDGQTNEALAGLFDALEDAMLTVQASLQLFEIVFDTPEAEAKNSVRATV